MAENTVNIQHEIDLIKKKFTFKIPLTKYTYYKYICYKKCGCTS